MGLPSQYHTDHVTALKLLRAPPTQPSLRPASANHAALHCPHGHTPFQGHVVLRTQYVALSDWLLSLSNKDLRSFHVFLWLSSTSFKLNPHCLDVPRSVYPLVSCGTSQLRLNLAVMNKAAVDICVQVFV